MSNKDDDQVFALGEEFTPPQETTAEVQDEKKPAAAETAEATTDNAEAGEGKAEQEEKKIDIKVRDYMQHVGETHETLMSYSEKNANNIYHLGNLITPAVAVDYLNLYRNFYPKPIKQTEDGVEFKTEQETEFAENFAASMTFYTPRAIGDRMLERDGSNWESGYRLDDKRMYRGQNFAKAGNTAQALARRINNTGIPLALFMPHTGIYLTFRAPHETEYCDYDMLQTMETSAIGRHTYGMMMNLSSGLYIKSMVEFALKSVTETNYDYGNGDMVQALIRRLDPRDYGRLLMGPTISKFPGGVPWTVMCPSGTCKHVESFNFNITNGLLVDNNAFTDKQRRFVTDSMFRTVTDKEVDAYRADHKYTHDEFVFENDFGKITFKFGIGTLYKYITRSQEYADDLHKGITDALGANATEYERRTHVNTCSEARRLTRYAHQIRSIRIDIQDGDNMESATTESYDEIVDILADYTANRQLVSEFEEAYEKFLSHNTHSLLAHKATECPACKSIEELDPDRIAFRGFVPISPDKVFFEVSQVISTVQKLLSNRSD